MPDPLPGGAASARQRYTLPVGREDAEVAAAALWTAGASGVWERPGQLIAWFAGRDVPGLPPGGTFTEEPDRDWQAAWKATIAPVLAGRFAVVPTWLADTHVPAADETTVVLDPGRAFGSGHHATTAQCLELLDDLDGAGLLAGRNLVDIGCGSGVLAIAAAMRGARAVGSDIDPDAIEVTTENATRNGVEVPAAVGSVGAALALLRGPADVVVANLVTDTIAELATDLVGALGPEGHLVASGIAADRAVHATGPLTRAGLRIEVEVERDGWIALLGRPTDAAAPRAEGPTTGARVGGATSG